jgi:hypothetical protein
VVVDEAQVVGHVAEERQDRVGQASPAALHERRQRVGERLARPSELEHLALEAVDRVGVAADVGREDLLLDLFEVTAHLAVDDEVVVDD